MESTLVGALAAVLLVNIVLSGDNAVVIGMAAKDLGVRARRRAILFGGVFAVILRLALTIPAEFLLRAPLVRAGGGGLLAIVAYRLLTDENSASETEEATTIKHAVRLIVIADLTMSLDNILAVAAVAERSSHEVLVLVVGLALSIPVVLCGGDIVARLMNRLPILAWVGGAILAYTAGELIVRDSVVGRFFDKTAHLGTMMAVLLACAVVGAAALRVARRRVPIKMSAARATTPVHSD